MATEVRMFRSSSTSAMVLPTNRSFCCKGGVRNGCPGGAFITTESPRVLWHLLGGNPALREQTNRFARGFNPCAWVGVAAPAGPAKIGLGMPPAASPPADTPASCARLVMRAADRAALATAQGGWPFASLVLVALDHDASPLLLISDLSEHAKNIKAEPRVSLLFDGTRGLDDPLTGPRVTVLGEAWPVEEPQLKARFVSRHPSAELYAGFADFHLHRVSVARAHLVAGFGRIHWVEARELLVTADRGFAREESATLAAINAEGLDLRRAGSTARLSVPISNPGATAVGSALARAGLPKT